MSRARKMKRAKAKRAKSEAKPEERANSARHEAAHAVVGVRLGLPLASTDIRWRVFGTPDMMPSLSKNQIGLASGYTTLVEGTARGWEDALPDPAARDSIERLACQCAG